MEVDLRVRTGVTLALLGLAMSSCGAVVGSVDDAAYRALVPTSEQVAADTAHDLPGGFAILRDAGINTLELAVQGDEVTVRLDDTAVATRRIEERLIVVDAEGSGPFKAQKEVLVLGSDPLVLGALSIENPVIWPGSFEESAVITVKPYDPNERGPGVSCRADERCLLLSLGVSPNGGYEDANNPELNENPIATIEIAATLIEFTLDTGQLITISRDSESSTQGCGLAETLVWDVPSEVGLDFDDPVLVQTACPSNPGDATLAILERADLPVLAPLGPELGGEWCRPGPNCLWFVPT